MNKIVITILGDYMKIMDNNVSSSSLFHKISDREYELVLFVINDASIKYTNKRFRLFISGMN